MATPGVEAVVLYDVLPPQVIERSSHPGKFTFHQVSLASYDSSLGVNDVRFFLFRDELQAHPEYRVVFTSDMFDVEVLQNPCQLVQQNPSAVCVGSEVDNGLGCTWMRNRFREMGGKYLDWYNHATRSGNPLLYSAGLLGGTREEMKKFLDLMTEVMEDPSLQARKAGMQVNVDMGAFNWVIYNQIPASQIVTGHPFHSQFKAYHAAPGDYFKHKLLLPATGTDGANATLHSRA